MSGMTTISNEHLIRSEIWSTELKEILQDEMMAQSYVRMLDGFPDGDTFTIPSIGQAKVDNYYEDTEIVFRPIDTGEFQFSITEYLSSGTYITEKMMQDSFYTNQVISAFLPGQERAIMANFETAALATPESGVTANSAETIDGIDHRWAGSGFKTGSTSQGYMAVQDFARARYALKKANVPDRNLVAIVDPSVEYTLNTLTNLVNVSNNPQWEGIVNTGIATGMRFIKNVYGFDVYTSNYLADVTDSALLSNDSANTPVDFSTTPGKANIFFSADSAISPFVGAWRQLPKVDYEWQPTRQRHAYMTTARFGVAKYRPENLVVIATKTDV